jgi:hypothetical protein
VTSEWSCVRAPTPSAIAVRLALLLTGKPELDPLARFATPNAMNSWRLSISSRRRAAKARAVRTLSE